MIPFALHGKANYRKAPRLPCHQFFHTALKIVNWSVFHLGSQISTPVLHASHLQKSHLAIALHFYLDWWIALVDLIYPSYAPYQTPITQPSKFTCLIILPWYTLWCKGKLINFTRLSLMQWIKFVMNQYSVSLYRCQNFLES